MCVIRNSDSWLLRWYFHDVSFPITLLILFRAVIWIIVIGKGTQQRSAQYVEAADVCLHFQRSLLWKGKSPWMFCEGYSLHHRLMELSDFEALAPLSFGLSMLVGQVLPSLHCAALLYGGYWLSLVALVVVVVSQLLLTLLCSACESCCGDEWWYDIIQ